MSMLPGNGELAASRSVVVHDDGKDSFTLEARPQTFLESLNLTPEQMASFIDDAGSFLYLTHAQGSQCSGSAYDLMVVEHSDVDPDNYFTLSCSGMTHFTGYNSDFTPLRQWEREFSLFHRIRCIPFFAKYCTWKTYSVWKKNVKRGKIKTNANALRGSLFFFTPSLRNALIKIQTLCQETLCMKLVEAEPGKTYELHEFEQAQEDLQADRAKALVLFTGDAQQLARIACDEVVDAFLKAAKIVADHRMTFMERASLRSECRKLTRFLRLVDFHIITMLRELALESVRVAYKLTAPPILPPHVVFRDEHSNSESSGFSAAAIGGSSDFDDESIKLQCVPLLRVEVSYVGGELEYVVAHCCCSMLNRSQTRRDQVLAASFRRAACLRKLVDSVPQGRGHSRPRLCPPRSRIVRHV